MRALLDINVLLSLFDENHLDHQRARAWLEAEVAGGWASCALTQNGYVRIASQPRYGNPVSTRAAIDLFTKASSTAAHEFWSCSVSILDETLIDRQAVHGAAQVTDVYLLALAVAQGGRFVTFDRRITRSTVPTARADQLVVI